MWDIKRNSSRNTLWGLNPQGHGSINKPYILFIGIRFSFQISLSFSLSLSVSSFLLVFLHIKKELYSSPIKFLWAPATLTNSLIFYMLNSEWELPWRHLIVDIGSSGELVSGGMLYRVSFLSFGELWDPETSKAVDTLSVFVWWYILSPFSWRLRFDLLPLHWGIILIFVLRISTLCSAE